MFIKQLGQIGSSDINIPQELILIVLWCGSDESIIPCQFQGVGRELNWLSYWVIDPSDRGMNPVSAITYGCAAIHFPTVYTPGITYIIIKCQFLSYHAYMVCEIKDRLSRKSVGSAFLLLIAYIITPPRYNWNAVAVAQNDKTNKT